MTTPRKDIDALVEATTTAWRPRDLLTGRLAFHPAWHDLDEPGREEAFEATVALREVEAAMDPAGLTSTARAVLARINAGH